jgi:hypothetical protein
MKIFSISLDFWKMQIKPEWDFSILLLE